MAIPTHNARISIRKNVNEPGTKSAFSGFTLRLNSYRQGMKPSIWIPQRRSGFLFPTMRRQGRPLRHHGRTSRGVILQFSDTFSRFASLFYRHVWWYLNCRMGRAHVIFYQPKPNFRPPLPLLPPPSLFAHNLKRFHTLLLLRSRRNRDSTL